MASKETKAPPKKPVDLAIEATNEFSSELNILLAVLYAPHFHGYPASLDKTEDYASPLDMTGELKSANTLAAMHASDAHAVHDESGALAGANAIEGWIDEAG